MSLQESIAAGLPGCLRERVRHLAQQFGELKYDIASWEAWHRAELIPPSLGSSLGPAWVPTASEEREAGGRRKTGVRWSRYQNETTEQHAARIEKRRAERRAKRAASRPNRPVEQTFANLEEFIAHRAKKERARRDRANTAKRERRAAAHAELMK